jgi:predicted dehydrogenase
MPRRSFLKQAVATTAGLTIVKTKSIAGTQANSAIELGIIGIGNRGKHIGRLAHKNTNMKIVALADVFDDRLETGLNQLNVDPARCHKGFEAYKELIASKVDGVVIETPPYYHPPQSLQAAQAGKHVFMAKPVAVDVPGCNTVSKAAKKAKEKKVSFLIDWQTRVTPSFAEATKRIHQGAVGDPVCGQVNFQWTCGRRANKKITFTPEQRLRHWALDKTISGDIIVEQSCHSADVANWYLKSHPVKAYGTGGLKARTWIGNTWDHFIVTFWYPNDVIIEYGALQFLQGYKDACVRIFGSEGTVDSTYGNPADGGFVKILGQHPYDGGKHTWKEIFFGGIVTNLKNFEKSIRTGQPLNNGQDGAISTLTCILGRMAAYKKREVTWNQMIETNEKFEFNLTL